MRGREREWRRERERETIWLRNQVQRKQSWICKSLTKGKASSLLWVFNLSSCSANMTITGHLPVQHTLLWFYSYLLLKKESCFFLWISFLLLPSTCYLFVKIKLWEMASALTQADTHAQREEEWERARETHTETAHIHKYLENYFHLCFVLVVILNALNALAGSSWQTLCPLSRCLSSSLSLLFSFVLLCACKPQRLAPTASAA